MDEEKYIYTKPLLEVIDKIKKINDNNIFLCGKDGTGKTTIVNYLTKGEQYINISLLYEEKRNYLNNKIYNLYYITLIISKIIDGILRKYNDLENDLNKFQIKIEKISNYLEVYYLAYKQFAFLYNKPAINPNILNNPSLLVKELYELLKDKINLQEITFIIDDFDLIKINGNYESTIYNSLNSYFKVIYVINNYDKLKNKTNIVEVDYTNDINNIVTILDKYTMYKGLIPWDEFNTRINFLLTKEDIEDLIKKTNGNIGYMKYLISNFYMRVSDQKFINDNPDYEIDYKQLFKEVLKMKLDYCKKLKRTLTLK